MQTDYSSIDNCQSKISTIVCGAFGIFVAFRYFMHNLPTMFCGSPGWDTLLQALVEAIPHVMFRKSSHVESDVLGSWPQQKK